MKFLPAFLVSVSLALIQGLHAEEARHLSLDECIHDALARNMDIRISRFSPQFGRLDLRAASADWDPRLNTSASESFSASAAIAIPGQPNTRASETTTEHYNVGLSGLTPVGLTYNLFGDLSRTVGFESFIIDTNGTTISAPPSVRYRPSTGVTLAQPLLKNFWIDPTRYTIAVSKLALKQDEQAVRQQIILTVTQVTLAYYNLIFARETIKVQQKALELAERLLMENKKKVEVGAMAPLEAKEAEARAAVSRTDLLSAQQLSEQAQNSLKELIDDDFAKFEAIRIEPTETLMATPVLLSQQDSWARGLTLRPDILQSISNLEQKKIAVRFTRNQLFPQLDLTGSYGLTAFDRGQWLAYDQIGAQQNPNYSYGARLSIPLSNRAARTAYQKSKLQREEQLLRHKRLEQQVMVEIANVVQFARIAYEKLDSTKQGRIFAEDALAAEQTKLENGKSTNFLVLEAQRKLTAAQSAEIEALTEYNKSLARLSQAEGYTLDQHKIQVEYR
ncbi:MAG: TolC family protein [Pedosphaera sp.]|nr:TolC family protein [Pedosphaera sp.]